MDTVTIPPLAERRSIPPMPPAMDRRGHSLIQGIVCRVLGSVPPVASTVKLNAKPSTSKVYAGLEGMTIISIPTSEAFTLPRSLLTLEWEGTGYCKRTEVIGFDEDSIAYACHPAHQFIQELLEVQLNTADVARMGKALPDLALEDWELEGEDCQEREPLDLSAVIGHFINPGRRHRGDIALLMAGRSYSLIEKKTSLSAGHPWWNLFPFFSVECERRIKSQLDTVIEKILSQCCFYAECISTKYGHKKVLVALSLPPTRLHYILFNFEAKTVVVTQNVIPEADTALHADGRANVILGLVDPERMTTYWEQMMWFQLVALYFAFPSHVTDAVRADALRDSNKQRVPLSVLDQLRIVRRTLGEVPPPSPWVSFRLLVAWLIASVARLFGKVIRSMWTTLTWRLMGTPWTVTRTKALRTSDGQDLDRHRWAALLPDGKASENTDGSKEFLLYRQFGIFIKIFDSSCIEELEAEVGVYKAFKELQGKGIPVLYGIGYVDDCEDRFLALSYEGEPLENWNGSARKEVQKILKRLHAAGFHHHDVSPRNVVVDNEGKVSLVDFGLSTDNCELDGLVPYQVETPYVRNLAPCLRLPSTPVFLEVSSS
ncbi:hypothetical protein NMY22_g17589 [Coprinellus aureogranulatus]|nr:hypothetical protein NMY22_g17589 [Coprinellus aureogranulatus]